MSVTQPNSPQKTAIIIGGGVAGIAAAVALESSGFQVTLLEARKSLGGRASSFIDPQSGEELDNCQHVLLWLLHQSVGSVSSAGLHGQDSV